MSVQEQTRPNAEVAARIASLTPMEREVLLLVAAGLTSKEIAVRLDKSPYTVDKHVEAASKKLGEARRGNAARVLREYEEAFPPRPMVVDEGPSRELAPVAAKARTAQPASRVREAEPQVESRHAELADRSMLTRFLRLGGPGLRPIERPFAIFAVAIVSVLTVSALLGLHALVLKQMTTLGGEQPVAAATTAGAALPYSAHDAPARQAGKSASPPVETPPE